MFYDIEIEKGKFRYYKNDFLEDVDIDNILVSNKVSFAKKDSKYSKYFIGYKYKDDDKKS